MEIEFNNKILETAPFLSLSLELSLREEGGDRIYVFRKMLILSRVSLSVYLPPSLQPLSSIHIYIKVIRHLYMYIYIYICIRMANYFSKSDFVYYKIGIVDLGSGTGRF